MLAYGIGTGPLGAQAIINNATLDTDPADRLVQMGIDVEGQLNIPGGTVSYGTGMPGTGTTTVGLRYCPLNTESIAPGCLCEGWGITDGTVSGWANNDVGVSNITPVSFSVSGSGTKPDSVGDSAVSVVEVGTLGNPIFRVTHDFHPSISPSLYEVTVTVENLTASTVAPFYRRLMDWDRRTDRLR